MEEKFSEINILNKLRLKHMQYLRNDIVSASIIQSKEEVILQIIKLEVVEGDLEKYTIERTDLGFITDGENDEKLFFDPEDPIEVNVKKFIHELSPYTIVSTMDLFNNKSERKISRKYNVFGIDV